MFVAPSMSLSIWTSSGDPYDHNVLAQNFLRIDQHDHSQGRGVQISTAGIQDNAVTTAKIAPGAVTSAQIAANVVLPAGVVLPYAGNLIPTGWLLCNGQLISRSTYSALFAAIGTRFGVGDGITTFAVPNAEDVFLVGAGDLYALGATGGAAQATLATSNMPAHTHTITATDSGHTHNVIWIDDGAGAAGNPSIIAQLNAQNANGRAAFGVAGGGSLPALPAQNSAFAAGLQANTAQANISASATNTGAGSAFSMLPPYLSLYYVIKF